MSLNVLQLLPSESELKQLPQAISQPEALNYEKDLLELERQFDIAQEAKGVTADLQTFFRSAWAVLEPNSLLVWSWHYEYLAQWLTLISSGEFKHRYPEKLGVIVNVCPRTAKSLFLSVCWPVWTWLEHPERRFLCASYSESLSIDHANKRRFLVKSRWFQERFGSRFQYTVDKVDDFRNDKTGYFIATSPDAKGTGFGGDICIADDILSAQDAFSEAKKKSTNRWLDDTFRRRLNNQTTGAFVHISQRLADDDPTGHLLEKNVAEWQHIVIPREAEEIQRYQFPLSGDVYERPKGNILQPERCPPHVLASMKLVARTWSGQEQQEPAPLGGAMFKMDWWKWYKKTEKLPTWDMVVLSVDAAFKSADENDYVAIHKWGINGARRYLLDRQTEHLDYPATKAAIKIMARGGHRVEWLLDPMPSVHAVLIEDRANGPAIRSELKRDPGMPVPVLLTCRRTPC